jgi:RNA polymerase sigma factor (sigma-70 family)
MPRLERGMDPKIDRINDLVVIVKSDPQSDAYEESMDALLKQFKPMILGVCKKWSEYFNDSSHKIKPFNELVADADYWFIHYTLFKYTIDGRATYNKFITDHINQRIRYIYECELKYYKNNIFPDPDKSVEADGGDMFETVVYNYTSNHADNGIEDDYIDRVDSECRLALARKILKIVDNNEWCFNDREKLLFKEIMYNGKTQEEMGKELGISRTRVVQILRKIKTKLYRLMNDDEEIWDLVSKTDLPFDEQ